MMTIRNHVQLIGHLGRDVELKKFENGKVLAKLTVATNESYRNAKGEKIEDTQWHNLVAWGKTGELLAENLAKGSEVLIQGKLMHRNYEDKEGNKRYVTEVQVTDFLKFGKTAPLPF